MHIVYRKGADNPVADNLSRMENILDDPMPVNDNFPDEQLAAIKVNTRENPCMQIMLTLLFPNFCLQILLIIKGRNSFMT